MHRISTTIKNQNLECIPICIDHLIEYRTLNTMQQDSNKQISVFNKKMHFPIWHSFIFRFIISYTILVFLFFSLVTYWSYQRQKKQVVLDLSTRTQAIVSSIAPFIDAQTLTTITSNSSVTTPNFKKVKQILKTTQLNNALGEDQIYILRKVPNAINTYQFVVMLQEKTFVGDVYHPPDRVKHL